MKLYEPLLAVRAFSLSPCGVSSAVSQAALVCDTQILRVSWGWRMVRPASLKPCNLLKMQSVKWDKQIVVCFFKTRSHGFPCVISDNFGHFFPSFFCFLISKQCTLIGISIMHSYLHIHTCNKISQSNIYVIQAAAELQGNTMHIHTNRE